MKLSYSSTKKGVASLYVVIFATILFGVITLSFIRIILSESIQTSNDDLSQSAYDAALAGVEDSKIAVNKYYKCLNGGGGSCSSPDVLFGGDCNDFKLKGYLNYNYSGEVLIQESASNNSDQAYTCVILSNRVSDYRSTLTSDTRTRVVPIGIGSNTLSQVKYITFSWYSEINGNQFNSLSSTPSSTLGNLSEATTPPTMTLTLLKTGPRFSLDDFNDSNSGSFSTMVLLPYEDTNPNTQNVISQRQITNAGLAADSNAPFSVNCVHSEFACTVQLGSDASKLDFEDGGNAFLIVSMPYGDTITDFAITLRDANKKAIDFVNVQVSVDSTGRANQLFRRVETRLDPADIFFPYPQFELELDGNGSDPLKKFFWITANCWTDRGTCDNNGSL